MTSFLKPENAAIADAIRGDAPLTALLSSKPVHNGIAPPKTPYPYISLSRMTERERTNFMMKGAEGSITATIWDYGTDELRLLDIYAALNELLHNNRLPLAEGSGNLIRCKVELILTGAGDQSDPKILRAISRISMWAIKTPNP